MIWGIVITIVLLIGFLVVVLYKCCKKNRQQLYTNIPSSPFITPPPAFPLSNLTPSPSPPCHGLPHIIVQENAEPSPAHTPSRSPLCVMEEEEEEPVSKRTRSQTRKKLFMEEETSL